MNIRRILTIGIFNISTHINTHKSWELLCLELRTHGVDSIEGSKKGLVKETG